MTRGWPIMISVVLICGCANEQRPIHPPSHTGTLHGGMMAIGGETTGWMLMKEDGSRLELDVIRVSDTARRLDEQRVTVWGKITTRQYVERGPVRVLVVEQMAPASD